MAWVKQAYPVSRSQSYPILEYRSRHDTLAVGLPFCNISPSQFLMMVLPSHLAYLMLILIKKTRRQFYAS